MQQASLRRQPRPGASGCTLGILYLDTCAFNACPNLHFKKKAKKLNLSLMKFLVKRGEGGGNEKLPSWEYKYRSKLSWLYFAHVLRT